MIDFEGYSGDCGVYVWSYSRLLRLLMGYSWRSGLDFVASNLGILSHAKSDIQHGPNSWNLATT